MHHDWQVHFLLRLSTLSAGILLFYLALKYALPWLLPFLIALPLAAAMEPMIVWCRKKLGFRRSFSAAIGTLCLLFLLLFLLFWLLSQLVAEAYAFLEQLPVLLSNLPLFAAHISEKIVRFCDACPGVLRDWLYSLSDWWTTQGTAAAGELSAQGLRELTSILGKLPQGIFFIVTTVLAVFYTAGAYPAVRRFLIRQLPRSLKTPDLRKNLLGTLRGWCRAQGILWLLTFLQLLLGLFLLRVDYALLLSFFIAIIDLLPILGTGTVLIPWALLRFLADDLPRGIGLLALAATILLVRSLMEPKLMASQVGLPPIAALVAMYLGFQTLGILGMILFPILLLFLKQLSDAGYLKLWK